MKRTLASIVALGLSLPCSIALVGCGETSTVEKQTTIDTPGGSETIKQTTEVEKSGDMKDGAAPITETPAPVTTPTTTP